MPPLRATERERLALAHEIARIEGRAPALAGPARADIPLGFAPLDAALGGGLDRAGLHEAMPQAAGDSGAAAGFAFALAARALAGEERALLVVEERAEQECGLAYGPGLAAAGLDPDRLVIVRTQKAADAFWAIEEGLRSAALALVAALFAGCPGLYDLTVSRRLALAARAARRPALLVFAGQGGIAATTASAAATRWEIASAPGPPGLAGEPAAARWRVRLTRNRRGPPHETLLEWDHERRSFADIAPLRGDRPALPADRTRAAAGGGGAPLRLAG